MASPICDPDQHILTDLNNGSTLPGTWYTDPGIYAAERLRIFHHCWQYVGLVEQVAHAGDFFTAEIDQVPVVVVCAKDGQIRAFVNVCRHRGAIVVREDRGHRTSFQCHYHAWTYNLDGTLHAAPNVRDEPDFDPACHSLTVLPCETWGPFIFVNLDSNAQPFAAYLATLPDLVAATGLDLTNLRRRVRRTYDIHANWKIVLDNYLECYHCPVAHPGFCNVIDTKAYTITEHDWFSTQHGALKDLSRQDTTSPYDTSQGVQEGFYAYLWPNFTLNIYPGPGNVSLNLFLPQGIDRTLAIYDYCFADAVSVEEEQAFVRFIDQIQEEDIVLCESVQQGMSTGFFTKGSLMRSQERALQHFQKLVYRALTSA